jgi:hypothetical protein
MIARLALSMMLQKINYRWRLTLMKVYNTWRGSRDLARANELCDNDQNSLFFGDSGGRNRDFVSVLGQHLSARPTESEDRETHNAHVSVRVRDVNSKT